MPELSLVIPAYNEAKRLPAFLKTVRPYADGVWGAGGYEVIVVDDGGTDELADRLGQRNGRSSGSQLSDRLAECGEPWPELQVMRLPSNQGKGAAVRAGMLVARGRRLLFADADGAAPIAEEARLRRFLDDGADVAVGSRLGWRRHSCPPANSDSEEVLPDVNRRRHRLLASRLFALLARRMLRLSISDTQCGFKMFTRAAGRQLFELCRENGYLFDLEVLFWAQWLGYRVVETPIAWRETAGSKIRLWHDGWAMARGLFRLRRSLAQRAGAISRESDLASGPDLHALFTRFIQLTTKSHG